MPNAGISGELRHKVHESSGVQVRIETIRVMEPIVRVLFMTISYIIKFTMGEDTCDNAKRLPEWQPFG
jgi:hypothetical protein